MRIGIDIGGSHYGIGIVDENGKVLEKIEKDIHITSEISFIQIVRTEIIPILEELCKKCNIEGIGISIPGTVQDGVVIIAENLNLYDYNIKKDIEEKIKLPIVLENDANCATLAEYKYGKMKGYTNALMLTVGTGIGGGMIINGVLFRPSYFPGTEIGHMVIKKDGIQCNCGNKGCLEAYASMRAFKNNIKETCNLPKETTGKEILEFIKNNREDEKVNKVIDDFINNLSTGISNIVNLFEPEMICIGGSFVYFEDIFLPKIKQTLIQSEMLFNRRDDINIECTELENDAGIIGSTIY